MEDLPPPLGPTRATSSPERGFQQIMRRNWPKKQHEQGGGQHNAKRKTSRITRTRIDHQREAFQHRGLGTRRVVEADVAELDAAFKRR